MAVTGADGHVGGADGGVASDGGSLLDAGTRLSGLGIPIRCLCVVLSPSLFEEEWSSLSPPKAPMSPRAASGEKIDARPTLHHKPAKFGVIPMSSMSSCGAMSSSSLPSKVSQTSPRVGQGKSYGHTTLLAEQTYEGATSGIVCTYLNCCTHCRQ